MKTVEVIMNYTEEVNSFNKDWTNGDDRNCTIYVDSPDDKLIKYSAGLTLQQVEYIIILIRDNSSKEEILELTTYFKNVNANFLEEFIFEDELEE